MPPEFLRSAQDDNKTGFYLDDNLDNFYNKNTINLGVC
jgi:hypothetical protein